MDIRHLRMFVAVAEEGSVPITDPKIRVEPLFTEPRLLCMSHQHPLADATELDARDILDEPMIDLAGAPRDWMGFWQLDDLPAYVDAATVPHTAVLPDGTRPPILPVATTQPLADVAEPMQPRPTDAPTRSAPLGTLIGARSGDKGGNANVGLWAGIDDAWPWLAATLTVAECQRLLPETASLPVTRHVFPKLRALNFVVEGLLGEGVAYNARQDPQAKAIGEWLRSRHVQIPETLLP